MTASPSKLRCFFLLRLLLTSTADTEEVHKNLRFRNLRFDSRVPSSPGKLNGNSDNLTSCLDGVNLADEETTEEAALIKHEFKAAISHDKPSVLEHDEKLSSQQAPVIRADLKALKSMPLPRPASIADTEVSDDTSAVNFETSDGLLIAGTKTVLNETIAIVTEMDTGLSSQTTSYAQDDPEDIEPFTLSSLKLGGVEEALEEARDKVFDWAASGIIDGIKVNTPDWITSMSMDTFVEIQNALISCIRDLDDSNLALFEELLGFTSSFNPEKALDRILFPGGSSCSNTADTAASGLPDVSLIKDAAVEFAEHIYSCLQGIDLSGLGFPGQEPQRQWRGRNLDFKTDVCPVEEQSKGLSIALGVYLGGESGPPKFFNEKYEFKVKTQAMVIMEGGLGFLEKGTKAGFGFSFSAPFVFNIGAAFRYVPQPKEVPRGYYKTPRWFGNDVLKCTAGHYCKGGTQFSPIDCTEEGYFCPPGSTTIWGEPIETHPGCHNGTQCKCERGYFCPKTSTTKLGMPLVGLTELECMDWTIEDDKDPNNCCRSKEACICPKNRYCLEGTGRPLDRCKLFPTRDQAGKIIPTKDRKDRPLKTVCEVRGCYNSDCAYASVGGTSSSGDTSGFPRDTSRRSSPLTILFEKAQLKRSFALSADANVGATISLKVYWDLSSAPIQGSHGFAIPINLPFPIVPSIALLFSSPPWHCLAHGKYKLIGIELTLVSVEQVLKKGAEPAWSSLFQREFRVIKELLRKKNVKAVLRDIHKVTGVELGLGVAYTYDVPTAPKHDEKTYLWCDYCESKRNSCESCNTCGTEKYPNNTQCSADWAGNCTKRRCSIIPSTSTTTTTTATTPTTTSTTTTLTTTTPTTTTSTTTTPTTTTSTTTTPTTTTTTGTNSTKSTGHISATDVNPSAPMTYTATARGLQLTSSSAVDEFTELISSFSSIFTGDLNSPFCFGDSCEHMSSRDPDRVIQGSIEAGHTDDCSGLELTARIDDHLKVKQVISVLFGEVPSIGFIDPLLSIGLDGPLELAIAASGTTQLTLSARRPKEESQTPATSFGSSGNILTQVLDFINVLQLEVYGKIERASGGIALGAGVCVSLGKDEDQSCLYPPSASSKSSTFAGVAVADGHLLFEQFGFQVGVEKLPALPSARAFLDISIGVNICPQDACIKGTPDLFLEGSVRGELGTAGPTFGGGLRQVGTWWGAFGWDRLQLSDFLAKVQFGAGFPVPQRLELGGRICVGSRSDCATADPDSTIRSGSYVGLDLSDGTNNYLVIMLQKMTLGNVLRAVGMAQFSNKLPRGLRDSGIMRSKDAPASCKDRFELPASVEEAAVSMPDLDLSCFAHIAISGRQVRIPGVVKPIEAGFSMKGRLLVQYGIELDLNMEAYFNTVTQQFKIDAELEVALPKDDPVATITGSDGNGPARFYVENRGGFLNPQLVVLIDGRLKIDVINTEGDVSVLVDSKRLKAEGSLSLLGIMETHGDIELYWDMSYFRVGVGEIGIGSGSWYFGFRDIYAEFKTLESGGGNFEPGGDDFELELGGLSSSWELELGGSFAVLNFDLLKGTLAISKEGNSFAFDAEATLACVIVFKAGGVLDLDSIEDSRITSFKAGLEFDIDCMADIAQAVVTAVADIADAAAAGLRDLEGGLRDACESAKESMKGYESAIASGITCTGAEILGAVASAFEAVSGFLRGGHSNSGTITKVLNDEKEDYFHCVAYMYPDEECGDFNDDGTFIPYDDYQRDAGNCDWALWDWGCFVCEYRLETNGRWFHYQRIDHGEVEAYIGGFNDTMGCEKLAYYRKRKCCWPLYVMEHRFLHVYWDADCYNAIKDFKNDVEPKVDAVKAKNAAVVAAKSNSACLTGGQVKEDAFELVTYDIISKPTETEDGQLLLRYKVKEFTNDGNGGCNVSPDFKDKTCPLTVPKGRHLNQFIQRNIKTGFVRCVVDSVMENMAVVPPTKPEEDLATATLTLADHFVETTCKSFRDVETSSRPSLEGADSTCETAGKSPQFYFDDSDFVLVENNPNYPCGTQKIVRTWTALDGCAREVPNKATQTIFIVPDKPTFDVPFLANVQVTTSKNPLPARSTFPRATAYCGGRAEVDFEDVSIHETGSTCKRWTMERRWTAWENILGCTLEEVKAQHLSAPLLQTVQIIDDTKPEFVDYVEDVRIPFFANYQLANSIPRIRDGMAHFGYGEFSSELVNKVSLSSADSAVVLTEVPGASEATCSTDGLAYFFRTWTVTDSCNNEEQEVHKVTIEHPPKTSTSTLVDGSFLRAMGVWQLPNACAPGKKLLIGNKSYPEAVGHNSQAIQSSLELLSIRPWFTYWPPDKTITTAESPLPFTTGEADGASFCGTPFEIVHSDTIPVKLACGVWTIDRTWTIRPVYEDCNGSVEDPRLVDSFVQVITLLDVFPPEFIYTPWQVPTVSLLANYGPDITGVPLVEDIARDPNIAKLRDTSGLPLVSYPITLVYDDAVVSFPDPTTSELCNEGAMAIIERNWTTTDACARSFSWIQTVRIDHPETGVVVEASQFQVITPGPVHIEHTDIAEDLAMGGTAGTFMRHVLLASGNRAVSWTGADPDENPPKEVTPSEQRKHEPRGVNENHSICRDNGLEYNLVSGFCPKKGSIKDVFLTNKSVSHGPYFTLKKKSRCDLDCKLTLLNSTLDSKLKSERCESQKSQKIANNSSQDYDSPIKFEFASDEIEFFSDQLANDIPELLTGPKFIMCTSSNQADCSAVEMSRSEQDGEVITKDEPNNGVGETIELVGNGMIYNFFTVNLEDWFFRLGKEFEPNNKNSASKSKIEPEPLWDPQVVVKSSGFVFVNVKYETEMKWSVFKSEKSKSEKSNSKPSVHHSFQSSSDGEEPRFFFHSPQPFGDFYHEGKDPKDAWWIYDTSETMTNWWAPRKVIFDQGALGQEYFLVNIPNPKISNPENLTDPMQLAALSLQFSDAQSVEGSAVWTGTLVIGNKHTSFSLKGGTWLGGQIILSGGELALIQSTVLCGRFAANVHCPL